MRLSHRVALNGIELDSIDNRILIQGIEEGTGKEQISAVSLFGGVGQRITNRHRDTLEVAVRFSIRQKKNDMQARSDIFEKVNAWAAPGGWLTVNYKAGRRLRVVCAQFPEAKDQWDWTATYTITFRAYTVPYWQQAGANRLTATGSSITRQMGVGGSADTVLDIAFHNTSGATCDTFKVQAGASMMELRGLGLANGETLHIDHTDDGVLRIRIQNGSTYRSALDKRTTASSDDLWVSPSSVAVIMTAQRTGTLTMSCAGRFV